MTRKRKQKSYWQYTQESISSFIAQMYHFCDSFHTDILYKTLSHYKDLVGWAFLRTQIVRLVGTLLVSNLINQYFKNLSGQIEGPLTKLYYNLDDYPKVEQDEKWVEFTTGVAQLVTIVSARFVTSCVKKFTTLKIHLTLSNQVHERLGERHSGKLAMLYIAQHPKIKPYITHFDHYRAIFAEQFTAVFMSAFTTFQFGVQSAYLLYYSSPYILMGVLAFNFASQILSNILAQKTDDKRHDAAIITHERQQRTQYDLHNAVALYQQGAASLGREFYTHHRHAATKAWKRGEDYNIFLESYREEQAHLSNLALWFVIGVTLRACGLPLGGSMYLMAQAQAVAKMGSWSAENGVRIRAFSRAEELMKNSGTAIEDMHNQLKGFSHSYSEKPEDRKKGEIREHEALVVRDLSVKQNKMDATSLPPLLTISHLSFEKNKGYLVRGNTGAGKSTLLSLLVGVCKPGLLYEGRVSQDEKLIWKFISQKPYFPVGEKMLDILYLPRKLELDKRGEFKKHVLQLLREVLKDEGGNNKTRGNIRDIIEKIENEERASDTKAADWSNLSGGESKLLPMIGAVILEPGILFLDESFEGMDKPMADWAAKKLQALKGKITLISICHTTLTSEQYDPERIKLYDEQVVVGNGGVRKEKLDLEPKDNHSHSTKLKNQQNGVENGRSGNAH